MNRETQLEYLTDCFFDYMRHNSNIDAPYYQDTEYASHIAEDYLEEHPDFKVPPMKDGIYEYDEALHADLESYCDQKCEDYGYSGYDDEERECGDF